MGALQRIANLAVFVVIGLVVYIVSLGVLMMLRPSIIAATSEGTFTVIFGGWVLTTLAAISLLR